MNGEPGGGGASECAFDDHPAKPTVFILNAADGSLEGTWTIPRPQESTSGQSNCTVHTVNMIPHATKQLMAQSFYTAGISVIDLTNKKAPRETGFVDPKYTGIPPFSGTSGAGCWTGYWYNGSYYCNELSWGVHIFKFTGPDAGNAMTVPFLNPQTSTNLIRCQVSYTGGPARAGQTGTVRVNARLFGPGPLQPAKALPVRITAPGVNRLVTTNQNGIATAVIKPARRGQLNVRVPAAENLNQGCSAPSKAIAKKVAAKKAAKKVVRRR